LIIQSLPTESILTYFDYQSLTFLL